MSLEHSLRNTGTKVIETGVYDHNFYMIDGRPTGTGLRGEVPLRGESGAQPGATGRNQRQGTALFFRNFRPGTPLSPT